MKRSRGALTFGITGAAGHSQLCRITAIARALRALEPTLPLSLISTEPLVGLSDGAGSLFSRVAVQGVDRARAALRVAPAVVLDTGIFPGLEKSKGRLGLILGETRREAVGRFALTERAWDLLLIPNPPGHWLPCARVLPASRYHAVGWVHPDDSVGRGARVPPGVASRRAEPHRVIVATGDRFGTDLRWEVTIRWLTGLIGALRRAAGFPLEVVQVTGRRVGGDALVPGCDRRVSDVDFEIRDSDLAICVADYATSLKLAATDVPVLLVAVDCECDDQRLRAARWAPQLGARLGDDGDAEAVDWMVRTLAFRRRRPPVDLGDSGAELAAELIREMLV